MYAKFWKRFFDFFCSLFGLLLLSPLFLILIVIGAAVMKGNPFFTQPRPGKGERIFRMIKWRSMTNEKDENGNLLPDEKRLTPYGDFLRKTSLDELPSLLNVLVGDMALIGPRPFLVRDMVFMTEEQRKRHTVRPGVTGLAQCSGRNEVDWEEKFSYDLQYIKKITLLGDLKILWKTAKSVLVREGITEEGMATAEDYGDYLLRKGAVTEEEYKEKQQEAKVLLSV